MLIDFQYLTNSKRLVISYVDESGDIKLKYFEWDNPQKYIICDDDDPTDFYIEEVIYGNKASQVLSTLQYNPETMAQTLKAAIDTQVKRGKIRPREGVDLTDFYESCLKSYTYLKK